MKIIVDKHFSKWYNLILNNGAYMKHKLVAKKSACCSPNKSCSTKKQVHELDQLLMQEATKKLAMHYIAMANYRDGKRIFKNPLNPTNKDKALSLLEQAFPITDADLKTLSRLK